MMSSSRRARAGSLPWVWLAVCTCLFGCTLVQRPEEEAFARQFLAEVLADDVDDAAKLLAPEIATEQSRTALREMAELLPSAPREMTLMGSNTRVTPTQTTVDLSFQLAYSNRWFVVNLRTTQPAYGPLRISACNANPIGAPLEDTHRFTFAGKGALHYVVLALVFAIPAFILGVLVLCLRRPPPAKKGLWIVFILCGLGQLSLNWTDGAWAVSAFKFQLLGAMWMQASDWAPHVISIGFPVGAVTFLVRRKKWVTPRPSAAPGG